MRASWWTARFRKRGTAVGLAAAAVVAAGLAQFVVPAGPPPAAQTSPGPGFTLLGVNLASAEFGITDMEHGNTNAGVYNKDYTYPTHQEIDDTAAAGLNIVRVPFSWERMQPVMNGPLDPAELARMDDLVEYAGTRAVRVLVDPHNYGYGYRHLVGSLQTPDAAFADFWRRMAGHYAGSANVLFGLMNEPHDQTPAQWLASANAAIAAIRSTGAGQEILVPGTFHSNGLAWVRQGNAAVIGEHLVDPADNFAFEIHQYLDSDHSGGSTVPVSPSIGAERLADVTAWAEATHHRLFLGEFGAGTDRASLQAMANLLLFMQAHSTAWQGGTIWGGGPWWPAGYAWATDSVAGRPSPQIRLLQAFLPKS